MHIEVFQSNKSIIAPKAPQRWYWHFKNKGRTTADTESFPSRANAIRAAKAVVKAVVREFHGQHTRDPDFVTACTDKGITVIRWS